METVKVGDVVECIRPDGYALVLGNRYTVTGFNTESDVLLHGVASSWDKRRFKLVKTIGVKATQIGGAHYIKCKIQPWEYALANNLGPIESTVLKYITRWKDKNGLEDLKKAQHALQYLIEHIELTVMEKTDR